MTNRHHTFLDTCAMPWEGNGDSVRKLLHADVAGQRTVILRYFPPSSASTPYRWFHRSVRETFLFLSGEYRGWEFAGPDDTAGRIEIFRQGTFMDRPPRSLHGRRPAASAVGSEFLQWHSHGGSFDADPEESVALPDGAAASGLFCSPNIVPTDQLPWQAHPGLPGAGLRVVAAAVDGAPIGHYPIVIVALPGGWSAPLGMRVAAVGGRPWLYVLWGAMDLTADGVHHPLRRGGYLDWQAPATVGAAPNPLGAEGCVVFCVGHTLSPSLAVGAGQSSV
ncbi:MAG: hypothetical protein EXQ85_09950 [Alphaproteobacteria bacterium]|nr:hypothetical protein [Alphaproteobacteria bacterium]